MSLTLIVFSLFTFIQLWLWCSRFARLHGMQTPEKGAALPTVSLVIAVKDDLSHIKHHLSLWMRQDDVIEVIIVDDYSSDGLAEYIAAKQLHHKKLRYISNENAPGKKSALTTGIRAAEGHWIILTDADCYPASDHWVSKMMISAYGCDVVLGYSPSEKRHDSFFNDWISYEHWYVGLQYLSAALCGQPYMGVGRNMAFRKDLFLSVGGYADHMDVASGDDDLWIQSLGDRARVGVCTDREAWMWTYPPTSWSVYIQQKRRHLTTAPRYCRRDRVILTLTFLSQLGWYVAWFILIEQNIWWLLALLIRWSILSYVAYQVSPQIGRSERMWRVGPMDVLATFVYAIMSVTFIFPKRDW